VFVSLLTAASVAFGVITAQAAEATVEAAETVTIPTDYKVESLRGLELRDGPDGAVVARGNDKYEDGTVLTAVNGQAIGTAREFLLLANAAWDSGSITVNSKPPISKRPAIAEPKQKMSNADWANSLVYSDTPAGVMIDFSLQEDEIGKLLTAINDQPITNTADARRLLAEVARGGSFSRSTKWTEGPDPLKADGPLELAPRDAAESLGSVMPWRLFSLYQAIRSEPPRPDAAATEQYSRSWGALASLPGNIFSHSGGKRGGMCKATDFGANFCYVLVWWQQPGQVLARYWFADHGLLVGADLITPTNHPGLFSVARWSPPFSDGNVLREPQRWPLRASAHHVTERGQTFQLSMRPVDPQFAEGNDGPLVLRLEDLVSRDGFLQSNSRAKALAYTKSRVANIEMEIEAGKRAERERNRSEAMAGIYGALTGIGQAIDQQNQADRAQFEHQLTQMQREPANGAGGAQPSAERIPSTALAAAQNENQPRQTIYSYCYMSNGAKATYVSGIGSKSVGPSEAEDWRHRMEAEFLQRVEGASGPHQCEQSLKSDFTYTRGPILADNPVILTWSPH
jgi:hypothetical protein